MYGLLSFLSEPGGKVSATRIGLLLVILLILLPRAIVAWKTSQMPPLSWEETSMVLGALGVKMLQRPKETLNRTFPKQ